MSHPFYLSVCDLKYNGETKKIEGSLKMFTNDLEDALKRLENKPVDLIHSDNKSQTLLILNKYLKQKLKFQVNGKWIDYELLGYEIEEESIWVYFESPEHDVPKLLSIHNSILYDYLKEQINIMNVEIGAIKKSWKLTFPEKSVDFEF